MRTSAHRMMCGIMNSQVLCIIKVQENLYYSKAIRAVLTL